MATTHQPIGRLAPAGSPAPPASRSRWIALGVIAVTQLMVALDATIVNVALPSAQRDLDFSDTQRAWVVTAYTLALAGLLLLGGRLVDRIGRRRALVTGLAGFALASALAGAAPGFGVLVTGRALQGASAALMAPAALSLIAVTFTEPGERGKAFGIFGAIASSGAVTGLLLGGVLTEVAGWRWCLYVNVVVAAAAIAVGRRVLPPGGGHRAPVDVASGLLASTGLVAVVLACTQAADHGWTSSRVLLPGALGVVVLAAFGLRQPRAAAPLVPPAVIADRGRATAYLATATAVIGVFGMFLMLTYHFQGVLGYGPLATGLAFLPLNVASIMSAYVFGARLLDRVPARVVIVAGLLVAAAGLALLTQLGPDSGYLTMILPAEVLVGAGVGCVFTPAISVATSGIDPRQIGIASAVATTAMQVGSSIGVAVLNSLAVAAAAGRPGPRLEAVVHGSATATAYAAGALLVVAGVVALGMRSRPAGVVPTTHPAGGHR